MAVLRTPVSSALQSLSAASKLPNARQKLAGVWKPEAGAEASAERRAQQATLAPPTANASSKLHCERPEGESSVPAYLRSTTARGSPAAGC